MIDEPIYRRLPGFLIATCDKFAMMPWVGKIASFFGRVDRHDADGFYGPAECDEWPARDVSTLPPAFPIRAGIGREMVLAAYPSLTRKMGACRSGDLTS